MISYCTRETNSTKVPFLLSRTFDRLRLGCSALGGGCFGGRRLILRLDAGEERPGYASEEVTDYLEELPVRTEPYL